MSKRHTAENLDHFAIYFTAKVAVDRLFMAFTIYDGMELVDEYVKEVPTIGGSFYENEIKAYKQALEIVLEEGYDRVILYNQNKLVFEWTGRMYHENKLRNTLYHQIRDIIQEIADEGTELDWRYITGDQNEASKYLKKYMKGVSIGGSLTDMFKSKSKEEKVVDFNRKAR